MRDRAPASRGEAAICCDVEGESFRGGLTAGELESWRSVLTLALYDSERCSFAEISKSRSVTAGKRLITFCTCSPSVAGESEPGLEDAPSALLT